MKRTPRIAGSESGTGLSRRALLTASLAGGAVLASAKTGIAAPPAAAAVRSSAPKKWDAQVDLVSLGTSSGGLVGAITGSDVGLRCIVLEKADLLGGGTSRSNAVIWIPNNRHQQEAGYADSRDTALEYIRSTSFGRHDEDKLAAFLDTGPRMLDYLNTRTPLQTWGGLYGDYYDHLPASRLGRSIYPHIVSIAAAIKLRQEQEPLLGKLRPSVVLYAGGQSDPDNLGGGRALIGALVLGCLDRKVPILTNTRGQRLIVENGKVIGVHAERDGRDFYIKSERGVLIATGGFEWNPEMLKRFAPFPGPIYANSAPSNEGDGHVMGMEVGGALAMMDCGIWLPALYAPGEPNWGIAVGLERPLDGSTITFGEPGQILVNAQGKRCCDESFYPAPPRAMGTAPATKESSFENLPLFWIADQNFRDNYALGPLPKGTEMRPWLCRGNTIREVAAQLGVNAENLEATVKRVNGFARQGVDLDFGRGQDRRNEVVRTEMARAEQIGSAPPRSPSSSRTGKLGTIEKPPFYGARIGVGTVGTRGGLVTNVHAQVINVRGEVIPGLYATSNAAAQLAVGAGYTSGQSHAQSMVFGYLAAKHMAGPDARARG